MREGERDDAVHRQAERDRVRDRERRDLNQDRAQLHTQEEQPQHEENVIEAFRQDVRVAERTDTAARSPDRVARRNCPVRSVVPLQTDAADPLGRRRAVRPTDGQRIRIEHQAVEPAQRARVGIGMRPRSRNVASGGRVGRRVAPARRHVFRRGRRALRVRRRRARPDR